MKMKRNKKNYEFLQKNIILFSKTSSDFLQQYLYLVNYKMLFHSIATFLGHVITSIANKSSNQPNSPAQSQFG